MNPVVQFRDWYQLQLSRSQSTEPSACCLSTLGLDGFPNARFVALKEVEKNAFIITGPLNSRKAGEILAYPKVALTFWWPESQRQVRVQGEAEEIAPELADKFFKERSRVSQILSHVSHQGDELSNLSEFENLYRLKLAESKGNIPRPANWGGFRIIPHRIEFMEFKENRLHQRIMFVKEGNSWSSMTLQP